MAKERLGAALVVSVWCMGLWSAEPSATMRLAVRVEPEARIEPEQVRLRFLITADGRSEVKSQNAEVRAWVRPPAGQPIRVVARVVRLEGPGGGTVSASVLRWVGVKGRATGGAEQAQCSSGSFGSEVDPELIRGWERAGSVSCEMRFELDQKLALPAGEYTGLVEVGLH